MTSTNATISQRIRLLLDETLNSVRAGFSSDSDPILRSAELTQLEQRILMSASPAAAVSEMPDVPDAADVASTSSDVGVGTGSTEDSQTHNGTESDTAISASVEFVVIDPSAEDHEQLVADLQSQRDRVFEILILNPREEGIAQITDVLATLSDVSAVHLVSHGEDGEILLGTSVLSQRNIDRYAAELVTWQHSMTADADLLIYGCDLAASESGLELTNSLNALLGTDVAASDDRTGNESLGGDWDLEVDVGVIESSIAFSAELQESWQGIFALNAHEAFDYPAGSLDGQNGGTGFSTAWNLDGGDSALVDATGLTSPAGLPSAQGGALEMNATISFEQSRDLTTTLGADGTTAWFSFLVKPDNVSLGGISLEIGDGTGADNTVNIGNSGDDWLVGIDGTATGVTIDNVVISGQTYFLAVRVDFAAGNDTVTLYVDPTAGVSTPDSPPPMQAELTTADLGSFNRIGVIGGFTGNSANIDEIRVGDTYADVAGGPVNVAPTADAGGPYTIAEGEDLLLDASGSSDPEDSLTYNWDLDNDGQYDDLTTTDATPTISWASLPSIIRDDNSYTIGLEVSDGVNTPVTAAASLTITNTAPTLYTTGTGLATAGNVYTLNLSAVDPGNDTITSWAINWGDGTIDTISGNPSSVTHTYNSSQAGFTFNILASATDGDGTHFQNELLVASSHNDRVMRYDTDGSFLQEFAIGDGTDYPVDVIIGPDGNMYLSGWNSDDVLRYNATTGAFIDTFVAAGAGGLDSAAGLAFGPNGHLYVASRLSGEVLRFDGTTGAFIDAFVTAGSGGLSEPEGLTFGPDGNLYVVDYRDDKVFQYDGATGAFLSEFVSPGNGLNFGEDLTFGPDGNLYVAEDDSVLRYNGTTGAFIDEFVSTGSGLNFATGLAFGPDGNLYVGGWGTDNVLRFNGTTGAFIDEFIAAGSGGLGETDYLNFVPGHQVTVAPLLIDEVASGPLIDGAIDAQWGTVSAQELQHVNVGSIDDAADLSGHWKAVWDSTNLYFLVDVTDDTLVNDSGAATNDDLVEIYIDADHSQGSTYDGINDFEYGFRYNDPGTVYIGANSVNDSTGVTFNLTAGGAGYILEVAVPWTTLGVAPGNLNTLGLDVHVTDDDDGGGRDAKLAWDDKTDQAFQDPSTFGTATLSALPPGNDAPTADAGGSYSLIEGAILNLDASASTDPETDPLTYTWDLDNDGQFDDATGESPSIAFGSLPSVIRDNGTYTISVRADDGNGNTDDAVTSLTITNAGPTGNPDSGAAFTTDEDTAFVTGDATANDTDPAGINDPLTITNVDSTGTIGLVTISGDGKSFNYDPNGQFESLAIGESATDTFTYTVSDGDGGSATSVTVTVTIDGVNDAPVIDAGQEFYVAETAANSTSLGVVTVTDVDASTVFSNWTIAGGNTDNIFAINSTTGEITVDDNANLDFSTTSSYTLSITVSDGTTTSVAENIDITVTEGALPPVAVNDHYVLPEGGSLNESVVADWFNPSWKQRQRIDFDNSAHGVLVDYSVRIKLHAADASAVNIDYLKTQDAGEDLRFVDGDGTVLDHEIESWDESGYSYVWVKVPQIDAGSNTDYVWMYYDNPTVADGQNSVDVWSAGDVAILHLDGTLADSSTYGNDGGHVGVVVANGITGGAGDWNGFNSYATLGSDSTLDDIFDGGGTISAWINADTWGENNYGRIADKASTTFGGAGNGDGWAFQVATGGKLIFEHGFSGSEGSWRTSNGTIGLDTWHHVAVVYDSSSASNDPLFYIDGVLQTTTETDTPIGTFRSDAAVDLMLGNHAQATSRTFDGRIDEFRVSTNLTSGDEIGASAASTTGTFVSGNAVESGPGGVLQNDSDTNGDDLTVTLVSGPANAASFTLNPDGSFTYVHNDSETTTDSFTYRVSDGTSLQDATVNLSISATNDNVPVITSGQSFAVAESAADGTSLGNAVATDDDLGTTFTNWTITGGNADGIFAINGNTGEITVADNSNLDFESTTSYTLSLSVEDGLNTSVIQSVLILVGDQNDNPPTITAGQSFTVSESASNSTVLGSVAATDNDAGTTFSAWTITGGNTDGIFQIDSASGQLSVVDNTNLNFESTSSYILSISVSDGTNVSAVQTVAISVQDENDNLPLITAGQSFGVSEVAPIGTSVGIVAATDADAGTTFSNWTILAGNSDGVFAINAGTGEITVVDDSNLDFAVTNSYSLSLSVFDGDNTSTVETVVISVSDENNNPPIIDAGQTFGVVETAANGTILGSVTATDVDTVGLFGNWNIVGGNVGGIFAINPTTGEISVVDNSNLDFESAINYVLNLTVGDGVNTSAPQSVSISVTDANDNPPVIATGLSFSVSEASGNGTSVGIATASDADFGTTLSNWSILSGSTDGIFAINSSTGQIEVLDNTELDYESTTSYILSLTVSDGVNTSATETVSVSVTDANDEPPTITLGQIFSVSETATNGTPVGIVTANDVDQGSSLAGWTIVSGNAEGIFGINPVSGQISVVDNANLDFEISETHVLTLTVSDGVNTSNSQAVTINVGDRNDNVPEISAGQTFSVSEAAPNGTILGSVVATDGDAGTTLSNWSIVGGNPDGIFAINSTTGALTVANNANLDFEGQPNHTLFLRVSDGTGFSAVQPATVLVTNVDEAPQLSAITDVLTPEDVVAGPITFSVTDLDTPTSSLVVSAVSSNQALIKDSDIVLGGNGVNRGLAFRPGENAFGGPVTITVSVSDGINTTSTSFDVMVTPVNDAPVVTGAATLNLTLSDSFINVGPAGLLNGVVDVDGDAMMVVLVSGPEDGTLTVGPHGGFHYQADAGFSGTDTIQYKVTDGDLYSSVRTVNLVVSPLASPPQTLPEPESESPTSDETEADTTDGEETTPVVVPNNGGSDSSEDDEEYISQFASSTDEDDAENAAILEAIKTGSESDFKLLTSVHVIQTAETNRVSSSILNRVNSTIHVSDDQISQIALRGDSYSVGIVSLDFKEFSELRGTMRGIEEFKENMESEFGISDMTTSAVAFTGTSVAIGTLITAVRSGVLALGFLTQLPIWTLFDPLLVVDGVTAEQGDSLQEIVDKRTEKIRNQAQNKENPTATS